MAVAKINRFIKVILLIYPLSPLLVSERTVRGEHVFDFCIQSHSCLTMQGARLMPPAFSSAEAQCLQRCETLHIDSVVNPCAVQLIFCDYARKGIEIVNF